MGSFRIQIILKDNTWSTRNIMPHNDRYSDTSLDWTLVSLIFSEKNYGKRLCYDQIDTANADLWFSKKTITDSVH